MMVLNSADVPTSSGGASGTDLPTVDEDEDFRRP